MVKRALLIISAFAAIAACSQTGDSRPANVADADVGTAAHSVPPSHGIAVRDPSFTSTGVPLVDPSCVIVRHENSGGPLTGQPAVSEDEYLCPDGKSYYVTRKL